MTKSYKFALFIIIGIVVLFTACSSYQQTENLTVCAAYDPTNVGELNMVKAACNAVSQISSTNKIIETSNAQFTDLKLEESKDYVIITAGIFGVNFLKKVTFLKNVKFLLCTHQWFDEMKDLHDIFLAIPSHVVNEEMKNWAKKQKIEIIPTQGVLHTMSIESLERTDTSVIRMSDAKIGLILGGDAAMPNGKDWRLFTEENARKLANEIFALVKTTGYKVLITNSPRTGAFINTTTRDANAHKNDEIDKVSKAFLDELLKAGLQKGKHFEFHNFQFKKPSALQAIMAIIHKNNGFMIVPGESTSAISEVTSILPATIYTHNAMNDTHKAHLEEVTSHGLAVLWPNIPSMLCQKSSQALEVMLRVLGAPQ